MTEAPYPQSYYAASANPFPERNQARGEIVADIAIVGGGYTGLSAALHLAERGYRVLLLEAQRIGWGASGRNGGQVNTGLRKGPDYLVKRFGLGQARLLFELAEEGRAIVRERVRRHGIACDLKSGSLLVAHRASETGWMRAEVEAFARDFGYARQRYIERADLAGHIGSGIYHGAILDEGAGHLHPLNYALGLAEAAIGAGAELYERSPVVAIEESEAGVTLKTTQARIKAAHVLMACNAYLGGLYPPIAGKIMPIANFIVATEPLGEAEASQLLPGNACVCDTRYVVNYFRLSADRRLLWGGGEKYTPTPPRDIPTFVRPHMLQAFPQLAPKRIEFGWSGMLAITMNRLPHLGRRGRILFAHGYSGQGVAIASLAGKLVAETVAGTAERFDVLASVPHRTFPGGTWLRHPLMVLAMLYYALRDRL
jgi:gamma-glutamylputrescine oxidase